MDKHKKYVRYIFGESIFESDFRRHFKTLSKYIYKKNFLILGAAGSIGASYVRLLISFNPKSIHLVDINENSLVELIREIRSENNTKVAINTYCQDILSDDMDIIFKNSKADYVCNFAALKHVRSEEKITSIFRMIDVNVIGTIKLINLCRKFNIKNYFSVSTDKASDPVNLMGASKNLMEKFMFAYSNDIRITSARFANVLFSNGSILNSVDNRIIKKQPIAFPKKIKRYFISLEEASQISLISSIIAMNNLILIPKNELRKPFELKKVILDYLKLNRIKPSFFYSESSIKKIKITNNAWPCLITLPDTSGEKLQERYIGKNEVEICNLFSSINAIQVKKDINFSQIKTFIKNFNNLKKDKNIKKNKIVKLLKRTIKNFNHKETFKSLNSRM